VRRAGPPAVADYAALDVSATESALKAAQAALAELTEKGQQLRDEQIKAKAAHAAQQEQQTRDGEGHRPPRRRVANPARHAAPAVSRSTPLGCETIAAARAAATRRWPRSPKACRPPSAANRRAPLPQGRCRRRAALLAASNQQQLLQQAAQAALLRQTEIAKACHDIAAEQAELDARLKETLDDIPDDPAGCWPGATPNGRTGSSARNAARNSPKASSGCRHVATRHRHSPRNGRYAWPNGRKRPGNPSTANFPPADDPEEALARHTERTRTDRQLAALQGRQTHSKPRSPAARGARRRRKRLAGGAGGQSLHRHCGLRRGAAAGRRTPAPAATEGSPQAAKQQADAVLQAAREKLVRLQTAAPAGAGAADAGPLTGQPGPLPELNRTRRPLASSTASAANSANG
jgi:exonuclease SbcC